MNPFQSIPDSVRRRLYLTYGVAGLTLGSVTAYTTAVGTDTPRWVGGASAVLVVIGTALGFTAASNVTPQVTVAADPPAKVTVEPIVSSGGVEYVESSDTKTDAAYYDAKHDKDAP